MFETSQHLPKSSDGGTYRTRYSSGFKRKYGATGNVLTITAPSGQIVVLTSLISASQAVNSYSVVNDGVNVITGRLGATGLGEVDGQFIVSSGNANFTYTNASSEIPSIVGKEIKVNHISGTQDMSYSYTFMEFVKS